MIEKIIKNKFLNYKNKFKYKIIITIGEHVWKNDDLPANEATEVLHMLLKKLFYYMFFIFFRNNM